MSYFVTVNVFRLCFSLEECAIRCSDCCAMAGIRFPILIIDSSSRRIWAGLKRSEADLQSESSHNEASADLFSMIARLLSENQLSLPEIRSLAICDGPGSMLGIRTAVMGSRAWEAAGVLQDCDYYVYHCLELAALSASSEAAKDKPFLLVTDARRNSWNAIVADDSRNAKTISILDNQAIESASQAIYTLEEFPIWTKTEANLIPMPYRPESAFADDSGFAALKPVQEFSPLVLRESTYAKWTKPHSA